MHSTLIRPLIRPKRFLVFGVTTGLGIGFALFLQFAPVSLAQTPAVSEPPSTAPAESTAPAPSTAPAEATAPTEAPPIPLPLAGLTELFQPSPQVSTAWIRLKGTRLFQVAGYAPTLQERQQRIHENLGRIAQVYLADPDTTLTVEILESNQQPILHINGQYLLTVTALDGQVQGLDAQLWAEQLQQQLSQSLETTRNQYQRSYLIQQGQGLVPLWLGIGMMTLCFSRWEAQVRQRPVKLLANETHIQVKRRSRIHQTRIREVQRRVLQMGTLMAWIGGGLFTLSRFPHTRAIAVALVSLARVPLVLGLALLIGYVAIRVNAIVIDRISLAVSTNPLLPEQSEQSSDRLQQRISTLTQVIKGVGILAIALTVAVMALIALGVNIGPLLTGAGILGVGISLASQDIIKDAINGLLIVVEDQYGVGDIVQIGDWIGLVESLNLRHTQLRNAEGKLITIPNSEIRVVANLSNYWSRVDLNLPVPYDVDLTQVMALVEDTAFAMQQDDPWKELIVESPQLMGVEDFGDRGPILKLWIKTQPLKQMDVAREYRRRLKIAFDAAGIHFPVPQRSIQIVQRSEALQGGNPTHPGAEHLGSGI